jgi:threonine dehydrogenase-like Zn-dependent dehydrogenase
VHRAAVRVDGTVRVVARPTPRPGPGELVIATEVAGLCGTDIQMLRGLRDDPAPVIGHEGLARVSAAGAGTAPELAPGTLVAVNPTHPDDPSFLLGHTVDGLLQERTLLPVTAVDGGLVLPLPDATDVGLAPLLEPLATVRYALAELAAGGPRTLLVIGDGTVGHLAVRAAHRWLGPAVRTVLVHHTRAGRAFSEASRHRADLVLDHAEVASLQPGPGPVAVLVATPRDATVAALESALALAGAAELTIDLVGGLPPDAATPLLPGADLAALRAANCGGRPDPAVVTPVTTVDGHRVRILGHRGVANRHLLDAAAELRRDPQRYRRLVTHVTDLDGAARVMRALSGSRERIVEGRRLVKLAVRIAPPGRPFPTSRPETEHL